MKKLHKNLLCSFVLMTGMTAQAQVVQFPMEMSADATTLEAVSNKSYRAEGALAPVSMPGAKGNAWRLDGYSSYLQAKINPSLIEGQNQMTFSLWVAPESYPVMRLDQDGEWFTTMAGNLKASDANVVESGDKGFAFRLGSRGTYLFLCHVKGWKVSLQANEKLSRYQWNHLVVTVDGVSRQVVMYNNGKQVATAKCQNGGMNGGTENFLVGKSSQDDKMGLFCLNTYNGLIDNFEIYKGINTAVINEKAEHEPVFVYSPERYASDILRPAFHGMPSGAWTNETHGAVFYNGKYHVFFQKNPNGPYMTRLNWGHIVSDNLYKWEELPTAISPEEWYDKKGCWSGCVFTDDELTGGKPNIFYTGVDYAKAMFSQAKPKDDDLLAWQKLDNNPIVDGRPDGLSDDFRDCFIFRDGDKLYMIAGTAKDGIGATTLHRYDKATGKWSNDGSIFFRGTSKLQDGTFWEMPSVTKFGDKWVFMVTPLNTGVGVHTLYWTGSVNGDGTFSPDFAEPKTLELQGFSKDGYGFLSPTIFQKDGKTLMLGIVPDKLSSEDNYRLGYAHTYGLPREISLSADGTLVQKPFEGLKAMRTETSYVKQDFDLSGEQDLSPVEGRSLELSGTFVAGSSDFGFTFFGDGSKQVRLSYSPVSALVKLDASGIDRIVQDDVFKGVYQSTLAKPVYAGEEVKLTVYVDHSIVDIFVNDTYAASVRIFPKNVEAVKATAFCNGSVKVKSLGAYKLNAAKVSSGIDLVQNPKSSVNIFVSDGALNYQFAEEGYSIQVFDLAGRIVSSVSKLGRVGNLGNVGSGVFVVKVLDAKNTLVYISKIAM